jgi:hypothetical protein
VVCVSITVPLGSIVIHPLVRQREFLRELGIGPRVEQLIQKNPSMAETLINDFNRLVDEKGMGAQYHAFCFTQSDLGTPVAFMPIPTPTSNTPTNTNNKVISTPTPEQIAAACPLEQAKKK